MWGPERVSLWRKELAPRVPLIGMGDLEGEPRAVGKGFAGVNPELELMHCGEVGPRPRGALQFTHNPRRRCRVKQVVGRQRSGRSQHRSSSEHCLPGDWLSGLRVRWVWGLPCLPELHCAFHLHRICVCKPGSPLQLDPTQGHTGLVGHSLGPLAVSLHVSPELTGADVQNIGASQGAVRIERAAFL